MITLESKNRRVTPTDLASFSRELGRKLASDDDKTAMGLWLYMSTVLERAEVFEFGIVDDRRLRAEGERGGDLMSRGLLSLPYPTVIYWYDLLPDPEVVTDLGNRVVDMVQQGDPNETLRFCTIASHYQGIVFAADFLLLPGPTKYVYSMAIGARFFAGNRGEWQGQPITIGVPCRSEREKTGLIESCVSGVIGLSMILATRGIPLRREEPPPKVNAKRAKLGKPPLTRITFVDCNKYYEAHDNTAKGGTHASPVPHLRRGHIRHYQDGKEIWIRDTIVNARSMEEIDKRERYDITKH